MILKETHDIMIDVAGLDSIDLWEQINSDDTEYEVDSKRSAIIFKNKTNGRETKSVCIRMTQSQFAKLRSLFNEGE